MDAQNQSLKRSAVGTGGCPTITRTPAERRAELERNIASPTFVQRGLALSEIFKDDLFRPEFQNCDEYCTTKWGFGEKYAYKLIAAAQFAHEFSPIGEIKKESHARILMELAVELRETVFRVATAAATAAGRRLSGTDIKNAAGIVREEVSPFKRLQKAWQDADADVRKDFLASIGVGQFKRKSSCEQNGQQSFAFDDPQRGQAK